MLSEISKSIAVTADSKVDEERIVVFRATVRDGIVDISKRIINEEKYKENMELCNSDYTAFESKVLEIANA